MNDHPADNDLESGDLTADLPSWPIDFEEFWRASIARDGIIVADDDRRPWDWF